MTSTCPQCSMANNYSYAGNVICIDCGYEWPIEEQSAIDEYNALIIKDANGNILSDGDSVVVIKDLKVKGSSITLKMGTKVKSIRLVDGDHEVDCKTDIGSFMLKACFLKKC